MTLKEIVDQCAMLGISDIECILTYLSQPQVLPSAPQLITDLLSRQINELEAFKSMQLCWQSIPFDYYYRQFDLEIASKLDTLSRKMILGLDLSNQDIAWCTENIPHIKKPQLMWHDLYETLHDHNIYFADESK